jgi:hypothetical protein
LKDYLKLWTEGLSEPLPERTPISLPAPITVLGRRCVQRGPRGEFAMVRLTLHPASGVEVVDRVAEKEELERLEVEWPDPVVLGLLDVLMLAEPGPLYKIAIVLQEVSYHDVDSTFVAFRHAGQDAGRKVINELTQRRLWEPGN